MISILRAIINGLLILLGAKIFERFLKGNKRDRPCPDPEVTADRSVVKYIPTQLVVWKKPGVSDTDFRQWKADNLQKYSGLLVKKLCPTCDDSLELWEGDNVSTFISEKVAGSSGTSSGGTPHGGSDTIACFSYNLIIDLPEPVACIPEVDKKLRTPGRVPSNELPLIVAVFDTGLLDGMKRGYMDVVNSCMPGGDWGWNFAYKTDATDDDYPSSHGSAVTKFIADQETEYENRRISILPVKVHNSYGKSDLFSILCGFAYAASCGAKIINASFGFYSSRNAEAPAILAQFIKKHVTDNNILLVAAAGNVDADKSIGRSTSESIRNLDHHPFFPACLSKTFENVLAVTTISGREGRVSPSQNFSNTIVDIGVDCDEVLEGDYRFEDPLGRGIYIVGSSYATPVITGKIAQHYDALMSAMPSGIINKSILLQEMTKLGVIKSDPRFNEYIKDGNFSTKRK